MERTAARCFVIGPIGNRFDALGSPGREIYEDALQVFESVIQPACARFNLEPVRADQISASGEITEQVFRHLYDDEIVIADVSGGNPNVMYELGLRHTRPLLTIQIGEYGQLPFDVSTVRSIQFSRSDRGLIDARKALEAALAAGLTEGGDHLTATKIWNAEAALATLVDTQVVPETNSPTEPEDDDGFLEYLTSLEDALPKLTEVSEQIGISIEEIGAITIDSNAEISAVDVTANSRTRLALVAKFSSALNRPAGELLMNTKSFHNEMLGLDSNVRGLLRYVHSNPKAAENGQFDAFLEMVSNLAKSAREANENLGGFGEAARQMGSISRVLRAPVGLISQAVGEMGEAIALTDAWESAVRLIRTS